MDTVDRYHFETLSSTNTWAKEHQTRLKPEALSVISADQQTGGRGQWKRHWHSPPRVNLYVTFAFYLPQPIPDLIYLALLLTSSAKQVLGVEAYLKWPNDLLIQGKKVAGVLCEVETLPSGQLFVANGIGVNVNLPKEELTHIDQPATSLLIETGHEHERGRLLEKLIAQFHSDLKQFIQQGAQPMLRGLAPRQDRDESSHAPSVECNSKSSQ